jgi:phage gp36-like protein
MSYATRADIEAVYPDILARVARDRTTNDVDDEVVNAALDHASALIDMRCSSRYALPLNPIPMVVNGYCIDIALYRMALTRDKLTAEMRQRYEDAIADLKDIAAGRAGLGNVTNDSITGLPTGSGSQDANQGRAQIVLMRRQG